MAVSKNINAKEELILQALKPFAEALNKDPNLRDNYSLLHAIRNNLVDFTGVSIGDLRRAKFVYTKLGV